MSDSTSTPVWQSEFNKRIEAFAATINVPVVKVREVFAEYGADGKNEVSLDIIDKEENSPVNDLFELFVDSKLTKKALLRAGLAHLRGQTHLGETADVAPAAPVTDKIADALNAIATANRPVSSLSLKELVDRYGDDTPDIWKALSEKTHSRPCVIYNRDGSLNKEVTLELAKIARDQDTPNRYEVDGSLVHVFRSGVFPPKPLEASPFFPKIALIKGQCPKTQTNWTNVSKTMRVLVALACQIDNLTASPREIRGVYKDATTMSIDDFRKAYKEAALMYDDLEAKNALPTLTVMPGEAKAAGVVTDSPFVK